MSALSAGRVGQIIRLGRPLHLAGGALFYAIGVAAAAAAGASLSRPAALLGLGAVLATQLLTHYSNDYFDLDADRANRHPTRWAGGSRVLVETGLAPAVALRAAGLAGLLALLLACGAAALSPAGWAGLLPALLGLLLAWSYSAPPLRLNWRGAGELTGALLIPGLTGLYGLWLQRPGRPPAELLALVPLGLLQFAMLVAMNLPDAEGDAAVGKATLVTALGRGRAAQLFLAATAGAYLALPALAGLGLPGRLALAPLAAAPISLGLAAALARGAWLRPAAWEPIGFWSIGQLMAAAAATLAALSLG